MDVLTELMQRCEERLKNAMLQSDVSALDDLLAPDLVFTNHLGFTMSKQDDLDAHRSGVLKINQIDLSDQKIKVLQDSAVVTVQAHIIGSFNGETSENDFRFTRVWAKASDDHWQIVVGHSCLVA
ncbi:MAG: nuclear transport factor 2 family protein [Gammaproteobacteria bacterium]|nr:nuclear transport factor 2 family protein [Gammaproteobacteria bacterium]